MKHPYFCFSRKPKSWTGQPDEIVQICASAKGHLFFSYVRPIVKANYAGLRAGKTKKNAYDVHGIGASDVSNAETWEKIGADFWQFVQKMSAPNTPIVLVAYNGWVRNSFFYAFTNYLNLRRNVFES